MGLFVNPAPCRAVRYQGYATGPRNVGEARGPPPLDRTLSVLIYQI